MHVLITITFAALLLAACSSQPAKKTVSTVEVYLEGNKLYYQGELERQYVDQLFELYDQATPKPNTLYVSSVGGDIDIGMDVGEWVHQHGLAVHVGSVCFSSCANYIFPASNKKYLNKDSILGWHGNTWQDSFDEIFQTGNASVVKLRNRETEFYKLIGVDYRIGIYGFDQISFWDYVAAIFKWKPIMGFDYSVEDMKKFGIDNIHLVDGEWDWRKYRETSYIVVRAKVKDDLF